MAASNYPKGNKGEDPNADSRANAPAAPMGWLAPAAPQVPGVQGGAPTINPNAISVSPQPAYRTPWTQSPTTTQPNTPVAPVMQLKNVQQQWPELTGALKTQLAAVHKNLTPDEQNTPFWQGFKAYPNEMAAMVVRRAWTNHMSAQGPVAQWMDWIKTNQRS